jgi:CubicO group peptidase (beta-lactamase class C family)
MRSPSRFATFSAMAVVLSGVLASCGGGAEDVGTPPAGGGRYPQAAAQGVDPRGLETASATLAANPYTRLLLVERNGVLVMEDHFNGASASSAFDVRSVTKTVMSILIGIAIDQGLIRSVEETIGDYLAPVVPSLTAEKAGITIRQLLTMTSGIPWLELGSEEQDYSAFVSSPDPLLWILNRPLEYPPGGRAPADEAPPKWMCHPGARSARWGVLPLAKTALASDTRLPERRDRAISSFP